MTKNYFHNIAHHYLSGLAPLFTRLAATRWDSLRSLHYSLGLATFSMWLATTHRNLLRSLRDLPLLIGTRKVKHLISLLFEQSCKISVRYVPIRCNMMLTAMPPQPFHTKFHSYIATITLKTCFHDFNNKVWSNHTLPLENGQQLQNTFFIYTFLILILSSFQKNWTSPEMQMTKKVLMLQNLSTMDLPSTLPPDLFEFFKLKVCAESTVEGSLEQTHVMMCTTC